MFDVGVTISPRSRVIKLSLMNIGSVAREIQRYLKTSRFSNNLFIEVKYFSVTLHEFFALELYFVIDSILTQNRSVYTNVKLLRKIQQALVAHTWVGDIEKDVKLKLNYKAIDKMCYDPIPFQQSFLEHYDRTVQRYHLKGLLLSAAAGTGKTYTSLLLSNCLDADKVIIVAPKPSIYRVWETSITQTKELGGVFKRPEQCYIEDKKKPYDNEKYCVFHYESLPKAIEFAKSLKKQRIVIILDESHNLNELISLRTQYFIDLANSIETAGIVFMTGTPIKAVAIETIPLLKAIDPMFDDDTMVSFKKMYAGSANASTEILARRYNIVSYKVEKATIKLDPPIEITTAIKVEHGEKFTLRVISEEMIRFMSKRLEELQKEYPDAKEFFYNKLQEFEFANFGPGKFGQEYKDYKKYLNCLDAVIYAYHHGRLYDVSEEMRYCTQYEKKVIIPSIQDRDERLYFIHAKTLVKYLSLKARGECLGKIIGRRRIEAFQALAAAIPYEDIINSTEKKTVVFTSYVETGDAVMAKVKALGFRPINVYGDQTKSLSQIVEKFDKIEELNPLVATYASLSTAVPLVMADTMIVVNPPFRAHIMEQTIARIYRLGATTQTRIFHFTLDTGEEPNICSRTIDIMNWSKEQVDAITGVKVGEEAEEEAIVVANETISFSDYSDISTQFKSQSILSGW